MSIFLGLLLLGAIGMLIAGLLRRNKALLVGASVSLAVIGIFIVVLGQALTNM